jgi:predicted metal-dependent phosphoesterase TrpH
MKKNGNNGQNAKNRNGPRIKVDLHSHTHYSPDSGNSLDDIVKVVQRRGLGALAITDHDRIDGALRLRDTRPPFFVIVGEEIKTSEGEIIGLFLSERVPPRLSPEETVAAIKEQGGVVYIPHPFDRVRRASHLRARALYRVLPSIDALEVINARTTLPWDNRRAETFCRKHDLLRGAGSDAHTLREIGRAWVDMPPFEDAQEFLTGLKDGRALGRLSSPLVHIATRWEILSRLFRPRKIAV